MHLRWLKLAQCLTLSVIFILLAASLGFFITRGEVVSPLEAKLVKRQLPKSSFEFLTEDYVALTAPILQLNYVPPMLHLPDLRSILLYYGQNGRPDVPIENPKMYFSIQGGKTVVTAAPLEKIYISYDKNLNMHCKYGFSPNNEPTMLWFTAQAEGKEAKLTLAMNDAEGFSSSSDNRNRNISLQEKEFTRNTTLGPWELGKWRVDGSLLVRQKAKWVGVDRFLENHGGDEFPDFSEKHRIDFGENDEIYSVYVKKGDFLIWEQERWQMHEPTSLTDDKPLLAFKKIDDRVMTMDLWDVEGKGKIALTLVRSPENFHHEQITRDFRFVGARTKTQVVFQVDDERLIVKPNDWLLLTKEGWRKLNTPSEIDDYVNRKLVGPLFIFQEIAKKDEKSLLIGSIYNPNRTEHHSIEVAMLPAGSVTPPASAPGTHHLEQRNQETNAQAATPLAIH